MATQNGMKPLFILFILLTVLPLVALNPVTEIQPRLSSSLPATNSFEHSLLPESPLSSPGPDLGITNWTHNHIENRGFENWQNPHDPEQWNAQRNPDRYHWFATEPPDHVNQGTYSGGIQTRPNPGSAGWAYWYQSSINADMRNLTFSFDFYAASFPSQDYDSYMAIVQLNNGRALWYYIVGGEGLTLGNHSTQAYFVLYGAVQTWGTVTRNVTADYLDVATFPGTISAGLSVSMIWFYLQTGTTAAQWRQVFFDDVYLQNETTTFIGGSIRNGNMETASFNPWYNAGNYAASYISQSPTSHSGTYSCNITSTSDGNASIGFIYQYPRIRVSNQNQGRFGFWWHLNQNQLSSYDNSMMYFQFYNSSGYFNLYYVFSHGQTFPYSNTSYDYYLFADNFNTTGSWQYFECNPWQAMSTVFGTGEAILNAIYTVAYVFSANAWIEFLIDDFLFIANAISDADYEDQGTPGTPIYGWNLDYSSFLTVTDQGYGGGKAANCTLGQFDFVQLAHDMNSRPLNSSRETYFDVMWRIETFGGIRIEFYFNFADGKEIHYILGTNNWGLLSNSSSVRYFNVTGSGTSGSWRQLHRDLVHDYEAAFGSLPDTTMTQVTFFASNDQPALEVLFDDLYIYDDPAPRLSNPQITSGTPVHNDVVQVEVDAEDQDLHTVLLVYRINSGSYNFLTMSYLSGNTYQATIPGQPWNTLVEYFFQANDTWGLTTVMQDGPTHYQYTVGDLTNPDVTITTPTSGATVNDTIAITATATDGESGMNRVEFDVDGSLVSTDTTAPYSYDLDTTTLTEGSHTITVTAYDNAGNQNTDSVTVTVQNQPPTTPPPPPPPVIPGYPIEALILGIGAALGVFVVIRRRRQR
jgi:hypothetical protein